MVEFNLTLLTSGLGTPFQVNTNGAILLIEDVAEPAFRFNAMLTQLKQAGLFDEVEGVVIGDLQADPDEYVEIKKVLGDFFHLCAFPCC